MTVRSQPTIRLMRPTRKRTRWRVAVLAVWLCSDGVMALDPTAPEAGSADYVQAWLGVLRTDDQLTLDRPAPEDDLIGSLGTLPLGGGAAQRLWGQGTFRIGYEGGGLISWKNHDTEFFAASDNGRGTLVLVTENSFLSIGVFMGGVASLQLTDNLRLQLAAGPAVTWARLSPDDEPPTDAASPPDEGEAGHDVSVVPYGRVGVEVSLGNGFMVGASMRYANDEFHFGRNGDLETDEITWLLTLGSRL